MFERFTERARAVVVGAQEEARSLRHAYIGTEHLLLGLLRDQDGVPAQVLGRRGVTLERAREEIRRVVAPGEEGVHGQVPFTPRAKKVLELSLRESRARKSDHIDPEHVMLGLLREGEGVANRVLAELGALGGLREELLGASAPAGGWGGATILWRPEGVELRLPIALDHGGMAALANDPAWSAPPLAGLEREIWPGWLAVRSRALLDLDPRELRAAIDGALSRVGDDAGARSRVTEFLRALREAP